MCVDFRGYGEEHVESSDDQSEHQASTLIQYYGCAGRWSRLGTGQAAEDGLVAVWLSMAYLRAPSPNCYAEPALERSV